MNEQELLSMSLRAIERESEAIGQLMDPMERWHEAAFLVSPGPGPEEIGLTSVPLLFADDQTTMMSLQQALPAALRTDGSAAVVIAFPSFDARIDEEVLVLVGISGDHQELHRASVTRTPGLAPRLGAWSSPDDGLPDGLISEIQAALRENAALT